MTVELLRKMHRARPFEPFDIHVADGRSLPVPHPKFLAVPPPRFTGPGGVDTISGMSVVGHGVDMVDCRRLGELIDRYGQRFLERVFTPGELSYANARRRRLEHLAGRFAVKEAVLKVLGTGWAGGIRWTDIEVVTDPSGRPRLKLTGQCRQIAEQMHIGDILVSISHIETHAIASAVGVGPRAEG